MTDLPPDPAAVHARLKRNACIALACWAVIASVATGALLVQTARNNDALNRANATYATVLRTQQAEANQILHSCIRLNILRQGENLSRYTDYRYISQQIMFQGRSLATNYEALARIGLARDVLDAALRQSLASLAIERVQAASKTWVPLTNCNAVALQTSGKYKPPLPISFARQLPPSSALDADNAALPDPVGSVPPR